VLDHPQHCLPRKLCNGGWVRVPFTRDRERLGYGLCHACCTGPLTARGAPQSPLRLYTLKQGERWTLLSDDRVMVIHPNRPPKVVYPDGRVEEIASKPDA